MSTKLTKKKHRLRHILIVRDGPICHLCGVTLTVEKMTLDHYPIPKAHGGRLELGNLKIACKPCNSRSGPTEPRPRVPRTAPITHAGYTWNPELNDADRAERFIRPLNVGSTETLTRIYSRASRARA